jgi:hypothetical protein
MSCVGRFEVLLISMRNGDVPGIEVTLPPWKTPYSDSHPAPNTSELAVYEWVEEGQGCADPGECTAPPLP